MLLSMTHKCVNDGSKPRYHCFLPVEVEQRIHDLVIQKFGQDLSLSPGHISGKSACVRAPTRITSQAVLQTLGVRRH